MSEVLTPEQAAAILGCSPITVIRRLRRREIQGTKPGKHWRTTSAALAQYIEAQAAPVPQQGGRRRPLVQV